MGAEDRVGDVPEVPQHACGRRTPEVRPRTVTRPRRRPRAARSPRRRGSWSRTRRRAGLEGHGPATGCGRDQQQPECRRPARAGLRPQGHDPRRTTAARLRAGRASWPATSPRRTRRGSRAATVPAPSPAASSIAGASVTIHTTLRTTMPTSSTTSAGDPRAPGGDPHQERQRDVERHLDREAPHLGQAVRQRVVDVRVEEQGADDPVTDARVLVARHHGEGDTRVTT